MGLLLLTLFIIGYCMIARRLSATILTAPMVFIALGFLFSETGLIPHTDTEASLHFVAEIALILLLFLDAAQIDLAALRARMPGLNAC